MKKTIKRIPAGFLVSGALFVLGYFVYKSIAGFSFTAYILFGLGGLTLCYQLLKLIQAKYPLLKRILWYVLTVFICIGILAAGITGIYVATAAQGTEDTQCDYLIVLGAGVNGTTPSFILRSRIDAAYDYLQANPEVICIVSGGQGNGEDISEAECMFEQLVFRGIDPNRIYLEDQSTSTRENLAFSMALLEQKGEAEAKIGILSSEFHLFRAGLFAAEQNLQPVMIPAQTRWFALHANYFLREIAGVWFYMITGG